MPDPNNNQHNSDVTMSRLHFYSLGIVAANKSPDTDVIEVIPTEVTPALSGELTDNVDQYTADSVGMMGDTSKISIDTTLSIKATWLPFGQANRLTSPDVRRGEPVNIYQFADTDQYWWEERGANPAIRRKETVCYGFNNNATEGVVGGPTTMYWIEISTMNKTVTFHTSKNDGEFTTYDLQFDTAKGIFVLVDGIQNSIVLNSPLHQIVLTNSDGSFVDINKTKININAPDSLNITTPTTNVNSKTTNISGDLNVGGNINGKNNINAGTFNGAGSGLTGTGPNFTAGSVL